MSKVSSKMTSTRSHMVSKAQIVDALYGFRVRSPQEIRQNVAWLLEKDRFTCPREGRHVRTNMFEGYIVETEQHLQSFRFRFAASEMIDLVYEMYFKNRWQQGSKDRSFIAKINHTFICLVAAVIHHSLSSWSTGMFKKPAEFGSTYTQSK